jgi:N-acetylmuramoyl-L-alanine amidase
MSILARVLVALLLTGAPAAVSAQPSDPVRLYGEAMTRETALRAELSTPALRDAAATKRRLRTLVGAYADLARLFPASGVGDKALWQGGMLAADAFWLWAEPADRATALRIFTTLRTTYPVSTLTRQSQAHVKRLGDAPVAEQAVARAPATPPLAPALAPATSAPAPAPPAASAAPAPASPTQSTPPPASPPVALPASATLTAIRHEAVGTVTRVTLEVDRETAFRGERLDHPTRVFVDLQQTRTQEPLRDAVIPVTNGGLQRIRVGRHPGGLTRVVLDLIGPARHSVYSLYNPYRVVIDLELPAGQASAPPAAPAGPAPVAARTVAPRRPVALSWPATRAQAASAGLGAGAVDSATPVPVAATPASLAEPIAVASPAESVAAPAPPPAAPATMALGGYSLSRQLGLGIARIVIDAGHGGHDPGAKVRGLSEASLTLDIALRLEELLRKQPGVEVVQTRRKDAFVSLEERAEIANRSGADLFISIHANASNNPRTRGVETYVLNFAGDAQAERVAARENAGSARSMRDLPDIVKAIALNNKVDESREFARFVQDSLFGQLKKNDKTLRNLGIKQAPFMVLVGATMPSVLTEVAFVTNREDAGLMRTEKYRQDVAQALLAGITRYQQSLKRAPAVAAQ